MDQDVPLRITLLAVLLVTMAIALYYRWRAAQGGDQITYADEGYLFALGLRLVGFVAWVSIAGWLIYPPAFAWAALPLLEWLRWTGVAMAGLAPLLIYWTFSNLGRNLTDTVMTRAEAHLVTEGPYRWVRHPFYFTVAWVLLAITLASANGLIAVSGLSVLLLLALRTPKEEEMLVKRFGDEYRTYMAETGQYFPRLW